jgi:NADPH-dependent F420 reductase
LLIGLIGGTGPAGMGLALRLASVGHEVMVGSRSAERASEVVAEALAAWPDRRLRLTGRENSDLAGADLVILATPHDAAAATAASHASALAGKVVVCMANGIAPVARELQPLLTARGSVTNEVAARLPDSQVVAAFQHLPARELADLKHPVEGDVLICSDHRAATNLVAQVVSEIPELRAFDAGSLAFSGAIESFTAVMLSINRRHRGRSTLRLVGVEPWPVAPRTGAQDAPASS